MPKVSVVIAVRNDPEGLRATLDALAAQTLPAEQAEVLVIDDGSTDATAEVAAGRPGVALERLERSGGAYAARNRGLQRARAAVVAITDAGCLPAPDWLERAVSRMAHEGDDAVLAGHIAMPLRPDASVAAMVDVVHHLDQRRYVWEEGAAVTANLILPAAAFGRVGPFDARLRRGADREWTRRAAQAGFRLVYAQEVVVVHPPRGSARELIGKSLAVGRAQSAMRREGLAHGRPSYLQRSLLVPRHRRQGKLRVRASGARPGRVRWLMVGLGQLAFVQLPQGWGALRADIAARRHRAGP